MIEPNSRRCSLHSDRSGGAARELRVMLARAVDSSFNTIVSTAIPALRTRSRSFSSGRVPCTDFGAFERGLHLVCRDLAEDVVRNGEGVRHVIRATVTKAASPALARALGKAIVNAPLFKCAVAGNDPNVGRLVQAIGSTSARMPTGPICRSSARKWAYRNFRERCFS